MKMIDIFVLLLKSAVFGFRAVRYNKTILKH